MMEYAQTLLGQTDGSVARMNQALRIARLCWNFALPPQDERAQAIDEMKAPFEPDGLNRTGPRRALLKS
jgi:hypothetical protein